MLDIRSVAEKPFLLFKNLNRSDIIFTILGYIGSIEVDNNSQPQIAKPDYSNMHFAMKNKSSASIFATVARGSSGGDGDGDGDSDGDTTSTI